MKLSLLVLWMMRSSCTKKEKFTPSKLMFLIIPKKSKNISFIFNLFMFLFIVIFSFLFFFLSLEEKVHSQTDQIEVIKMERNSYRKELDTCQGNDLYMPQIKAVSYILDFVTCIEFIWSWSSSWYRIIWFCNWTKFRVFTFILMNFFFFFFFFFLLSVLIKFSDYHSGWKTKSKNQS